MDDRVSRYPGRVKMVPVPGQPNVYDMTLADEPTVAGTKLNKANLLSDQVASSLGGVATPSLALQKLKQLVDTAQSTANIGTTKAKIVQGSYVGTDELTKTINLGFSPKFMVIMEMYQSVDGAHTIIDTDYYLLWTGQTKLYSGSNRYGGTISATGNGITMSITKEDSGHENWIYAGYVYNSKGKTYRYVGVG